MCARKGFDAVEPDIDDSYACPTGFAISRGDNVAFDTTLSAWTDKLDRWYGWSGRTTPRQSPRLARRRSPEPAIKRQRCRSALSG